MATINEQINSMKVIGTQDKCYLAKVTEGKPLKDVPKVNREITEEEILWIINWFATKYFRENGVDTIPFMVNDKKVFEIRKEGAVSEAKNTNDDKYKFALSKIYNDLETVKEFIRSESTE